jgi:hypothetical protein
MWHHTLCVLAAYDALCREHRARLPTPLLLIATAALARAQECTTFVSSFGDASTGAHNPNAEAVRLLLRTSPLTVRVFNHIGALPERLHAIVAAEGASRDAAGAPDGKASELQLLPPAVQGHRDDDVGACRLHALRLSELPPRRRHDFIGLVGPALRLHAPTLRTIALNGVCVFGGGDDVGRPAVAALVAAVAAAPQLTSLVLRWCKMPAPAVKELLTVLSAGATPRLRVLDLSYNDIGMGSAPLVTEVALRLPRLREIHVVETGVGNWRELHAVKETRPRLVLTTTAPVMPGW